MLTISFLSKLYSKYYIKNIFLTLNCIKLYLTVQKIEKNNELHRVKFHTKLPNLQY